MAKADNKYIIGLLCLVAAFTLASCAGQKNSPVYITAAKMASGIDEKLMPVQVTNTFPKDAVKVFCWFKWKNAVINSQIMASWHYVTDDIHILDYNFVIPRKEGSGSVSLVMPQNKLLPSGSYRLDLKAGEQKLRTLTFSVEE